MDARHFIYLPRTSVMINVHHISTVDAKTDGLEVTVGTRTIHVAGDEAALLWAVLCERSLQASHDSVDDPPVINLTEALRASRAAENF